MSVWEAEGSRTITTAIELVAEMQKARQHDGR